MTENLKNFNQPEPEPQSKDLLVKITTDEEGKYPVVSDALTGEELTNVKDVSVFYDSEINGFVASLEIYYPILDLVARAEVSVRGEEE